MSFFPAQAGTRHAPRLLLWFPAFAGMSERVKF
jgi:hypothetical protein